MDVSVPQLPLRYTLQRQSKYDTYAENVKWRDFVVIKTIMVRFPTASFSSLCCYDGEPWPIALVSSTCTLLAYPCFASFLISMLKFWRGRSTFIRKEGSRPICKEGGIGRKEGSVVALRQKKACSGVIEPSHYHFPFPWLSSLGYFDAWPTGLVSLHKH